MLIRGEEIGASVTRVNASRLKGKDTTIKLLLQVFVSRPNKETAAWIDTATGVFRII